MFRIIGYGNIEPLSLVAHVSGCYLLANKLSCCIGWIADQLSAHKNQFVSEPEGLRQFQDHHWEALGKENSDLPGSFSVIIF